MTEEVLNKFKRELTQLLDDKFDKSQKSITDLNSTMRSELEGLKEDLRLELRQDMELLSEELQRHSKHFTKLEDKMEEHQHETNRRLRHYERLMHDQPASGKPSDSGDPIFLERGTTEFTAPGAALLERRDRWRRVRPYGK